MRCDGGFFDVQINGGFGHHFSDDPSAIWSVGEQLLQYGITQFLPTLVSSGFDRLDDAIAVLGVGPPDGWIGAEPVGWHVEGPWLSQAHVGAHDSRKLRALADDHRLSAANGIRLVTLAPELDGSADAIAGLRSRGVVVSAGHSAADLAEADSAFEAGVGMITHLFNAMSGLHHRSPGLAAAALLAGPSVSIGLICDGVHVAPAMVRLAHRLAGERIVLVSDAVSELGVSDRRVATLPDGTLAGATIGLDRCVANYAHFTGCELSEAAVAASSRPRSMLGVAPPAGSWVELDDRGRVAQTVLRGELVFATT